MLALSPRPRRAFAEPLGRSAYSLMANTVLTSVFGLGFWLAAARLFPAAEVGQDSAAIAALIVLSSICQLDLGNVLVRFLPGRRRHAGRFIAAAYALSVAVSLVAAVGFVLAAGRWLPSLSFLADNPTLAVGFCVLAALWAVFALQDYVLTALRRAPWVPMENALFGMLKLAALPLMLLTSFRHGVFLAWVAPVIVLIAGVNILLFRRALPQRERDHAQRPACEERLTAGTVVRFAAYDYLAGVCNQIATWLLPVLVLLLLGSGSNAFFYVAFTVATAFDMLFVNASSSLVAEGAIDQPRLGELTRWMVRRCTVFLVLGALCLIVAAPVILMPFGAQYAGTSAGVLRLLVLASGFRATIALFTALCRLRRRTSWVLAANFTLAALLLPLTVVLGARMGVTGVGLAWLIAHAVVGLAVLPAIARLVRTARRGAAAPSRTAPRSVRPQTQGAPVS